MNRVSTFYQFTNLQNMISQTGQAYFDAQNKVSSGKRINNLSDDPTGLSSVISMSSVKAGLSQYSSNLDHANQWLTTSESSLTEVNTLLNRANVLAVSGANATASSSERQAMASEVSSIRDRLVQLANSKDGSGNYIFAGTATSTTPFTVSGNSLVYNGDQGKVKVESAPGQTMDLSLPSMDSFFKTTYNDLTTTLTALQNNDQSTLSNTSLAKIQSDLQSVNLTQGEIGNRTRAVTDLQSDNTRRITELTTNVSGIQDVNMAQAITDYQGAQTAYQAALQMAGQGMKLSLMDYITG